MAPFPQGKFIDPSFEAEFHSQQRGLRDLLTDTRRQRRQTQQDFGRGRRDLRVQRRRGLQDILRDRDRGMEDLTTQRDRGLRGIGQQREDVTTGAARGREDFGTQLTNLIRNFQVMGQQQREGAVAAGITGGTTAQASAAARAGNLARARQPIDTGLQRLEQDTTRDLGRLDLAAGDIRSDFGTQTSRLGQDTRLGRQRLRQDSRFNMRGLRMDRQRGLRDLTTQRKRGRRELAIARPNLAAQAQFNRRILRQSLPGQGAR